jgi:hypothetical protein
VARTGTQEVLYMPLAVAGAIKFEGKAILTDTKLEFKALPYEVEYNLEPLLFRIYIPKITVKKLNATVTFYIEDVTGAAQIIAEATCEGITAASNTGPVLIERRFTPAVDATIEKELQGERKFTLQAEASAESAEIPTNTAKCVCFLQILGLGRD